MTNAHKKKLYSNLLKKVKNDSFYTEIDMEDRVNCYTCRTCSSVTKTIDIDPGVTPMIINCPVCRKEAFSSGYDDIRPNKVPSRVFYRPTLKEVLKEKNLAKLQHVFDGGLLMKKIVKGQKFKKQ